MSPQAFQRAVLDWFEIHGRKHLPWQQAPTPYRVWVSEIMLQQTQVATVIPYFYRFMQRFPDLSTLAAAELDEVLSYWAGLGYYSRARNLHGAAREVAERHAGRLPERPEALEALPGIGRSTAGAILSLGHGLPAAILDGNVKRVLSRHAGIAGWSGETRVLRELWELSERYTPTSRTAEYNQAMMDLGATVCTRTRPSCDACPLSGDCEAHRSGQTASIPAPRPNRAMPVRRCLLAVLNNRNGEFWLQRRPPTGIWGGLLCLPEFDDLDAIHEWCIQRGLEVGELECLPERRHTFSHFHLDYRPVIGLAKARYNAAEPGHGAWFAPHPDLALPAPVRRLLEECAAGASQPSTHKA